MRLNRKTRIGLLIIGGALILLLLVKLFQGLTATPEATVDNTSNTTDNTAQTVALSGSGMAAVARREIPERSIITADMLEMVQVPRDTEGSTGSTLYVSDPLSQAVGFITNKRISPRQRVLRSDLVGHITTVGVAGALRPGFRAQVIPIPNKSTLHDLVAIGDTIDIIASFDGQEARTIASNVRVLAVDVFGNDFPQVKIARRGDYKADPAGVGTANPPSPNTGAPGAQTAPAQPAPGAPPAAQPTPTATPAPEGPPPAKPDPALTVEVTPDQTTAIALAQNAGAALDYVLRPRPAITTAVPETRVVALTKPRLAPYADRVKRNTQSAAARSNNAGGTGGTRVASTSGNSGSGNRGSGNRGGGGWSGSTPLMPPPPPTDTITPANPNGGATTIISTPSVPETYQIPIYGDGKVTRYDTVRKP